ncbi:MAG: LptF/LptG family permease [bacterium]
MKILHRYILKEHISPFFFGMCLFTFIFFLSEIFKSSELIITKQISGILIIKLFLCYIPATFNITIPIAILMATLITWGTLKAENEITAIWASGISLISSIVWMIILGIFLSFTTLIIEETLLPWTNYTIEKIHSNLIHQQPSIYLEERRFIKLGQRELFIDELDKQKRQLEGIYIYEYRSDFGVPKEAIFAKSAKYTMSQAGIILNLKEGTIHQIDEKDPSKYHVLTFDIHTISLGGKENEIATHAPKGIEAMTFRELKKEIKKYKKLNLNFKPLLIELSKHLAMPFSCLAFILIGLPLGLLVRHKEKSIGFGTSILIVFIYYIMLKLNENLAEKELIAPILAMWLPNILLGTVGIILLTRLLRRT